MTTAKTSKRVAIVGAGPAGLFAAERIARAGHDVTVYDHMPSPARKFLMAGRGGLNLTHTEPLERFLDRYSPGVPDVKNAVRAFPPAALIDWANALGAETFVGSSGRVFPKAMKASPLLRAWLTRLKDQGIAFRFRHRWTGFSASGGLNFTDAGGSTVEVTPDATLFALGGASWPRLGSDAAWVRPFRDRGIAVTDLEPANCGIEIAWSDHLKDKYAGVPLKRIAVACGEATRRGEAVITRKGLEGGAIYALVPAIRAALAGTGRATIRLDLKPDMDEADLGARLARRRSTQTQSNLLRKAAGLSPAAANLLRERGPLPTDAQALARRIKGVEFDISSLAGIARAISTAGGVSMSALMPDFELKTCPGTFIAGEMLDWEAPTGGYLLQGVFATARAAADGLLDRLAAGAPIAPAPPRERTSHQARE